MYAAPGGSVTCREVQEKTMHTSTELHEWDDTRPIAVSRYRGNAVSSD